MTLFKDIMPYYLMYTCSLLKSEHIVVALIYLVIRICRRLVAKSGQAEILEILFWTGISETLAKTLGGDEDYVQGWM